MVGKGSIKTENGQMASIGEVLSSTYYTKQINVWPILKASCVMIYSLLSACPGKQFKDCLSTCGHLMNLRNKPQQKHPSNIK